MIRLKKILHYNSFYIILLVLLLIYCLFYFQKENKVIIPNGNSIVGTINNYKVDASLLTLEVNANKTIIAYYYFKTKEEKESFTEIYKLGDKVKLVGNFSLPENNTIPNLFNYKKYLKYKHINIIMQASSINKVGSNKKLLYNIKNKIYKHLEKYKSKAYLKAFILGNKNDISKDTVTSYQENGISHLLAISGMHVSILSLFILLIFKNNKYKLGITSTFLIFYMFLTGLLPSVCRSVLLFIMLHINKKLKLDIQTLKIFLLVAIIVIFINPFIIYDLGFIYSYTITFFLILFKDKINSDSYLKSIFKISLLSFFASIPITLYYFYEINFLSIILNIIFVPFISIIVFPVAIITFLIPLFDNILFILISILENLSAFFNSVNILRFPFGKVNLIFIISYYLFLLLFLYFDKKRYLLFLIGLLLFQYNYNFLFPKEYIIFIDVDQGDSILINYNHKTVLIDTGGKLSLNKEEWEKKPNSIASKSLIPLFKSLGIRKLNYLITTHGDFDHMGEAINLVNNFKIEKVIFNCGEFNDLEKELIKVLDKKKIPYYSCIKELNIDKNKLYFLQTKEYDNENDNSNVIYTELDEYKFMFMGDAGVDKEKDILGKYNITDVDVLKVGHHGSKTSSSKSFIDEINPNYSIISVGKNNRYGHPNNEVLNNLDNSKIYRTDQDGSIMFKITNNKLKIETCSP